MLPRLLFSLLFLLSTLLLTAQDNQATPSSKTSLDELVEQVESAMGGRTAYNNTRYLQWTFFGRRDLRWDKWTGDVRIDFAESKDVYIVNLNDGKGKIWLDGNLQTHPDTLSKYLGRAKDIWINDSYWLVMPWKLQDPGVTLTDLGIDDATNRQKLELTFDQVGKTPENKYHVFVDLTTHLVDEWQFFNQNSDEKPAFSTPWTDYQAYGDILLSGDRGRGKLTNIAAPKSFPKGTFEDLSY